MKKKKKKYLVVDKNKGVQMIGTWRTCSNMKEKEEKKKMEHQAMDKHKMKNKTLNFTSLLLKELQ
eukprot:gene1204-32546_t